MKLITVEESTKLVVLSRLLGGKADGYGHGDGDGYGDWNGDGDGDGDGYGDGNGNEVKVEVDTLPETEMKMIGQFVIVRAMNAGCFAGEYESEEADRVVLRNSRRLWHWEGAASLSQLAVTGTSNPGGCKFPPAVARQKIFGVLELIEVTPQGRKSIESVPVWTA